MALADVRDVVIIITGLVNTGILIALLFVVLSTARRTNIILDSLAEASRVFHEVAIVVEGVVKGFDFIGQMFNKVRGGKKDEQG